MINIPPLAGDRPAGDPAAAADHPGGAARRSGSARRRDGRAGPRAWASCVPVLIAPEAPRPPSIGTIAPTEPPKATLPTVTARPPSPPSPRRRPTSSTPFDLGRPAQPERRRPDLAGVPRGGGRRCGVGCGVGAVAERLDQFGSVASGGPVGSGGGGSRLASVARGVWGVEDAPAQIAAPQLVLAGGSGAGAEPVGGVGVLHPAGHRSGAGGDDLPVGDARGDPVGGG